jgi:glycosyltransferase involved in cell wall biosynthesis
MRVLIGAAGGTGTGGVLSYILTLRDALNASGNHAELQFPDEATKGWMISAALRALGDRDKARRELTKIRTENVLKKTRAELKNGTWDLIHAQEVNYGSRAVDLGLPVVLTVHGPVSREAKMLGKASAHYYNYLVERERIAYERAAHIIAVDTGQRDIVVEDYGIDPQKITVILNAVDTDRFAPQPVAPPEKPFFLVPRRLVPKNGVLTAVKAYLHAPELPEELWIAGDGPEMQMLQDFVTQNGLSERVRFLGSIDHSEMVPLMNRASGVIIPSVPVAGVIEASSISALEGMSIAKPVIASNIGGLAEIIEDGVNGVHFEAGNDQELASALRKVSGDKEWAQALGARARQSVIEEHSSAVWIRKVVNVYEQVLAR